MSKSCCWLILVLSLGLNACGVYSFSGAALPPNVETISVAYLDNSSGNGPASLSQIVTDRLREKFIRETSLSVVDAQGDLQIRGEITSYSVVLQAASAEGQDDFNKLTINLRIEFLNTLDPEDQWNQNFSMFELVSSSQDLTIVENELIESISDQLADNIFNQALVKW